MPDSATPVARPSRDVAKSPREMMPTRRFSSLSTGRRRICSEAMFWARSSMSSSSKQYFTSALITSRTGASGPSIGGTSHCDIPVRDHSHQTIVVADRQHADVALFHLGRSLAQRLARARETDISCHDFTHLHPVLLFLRDASSYATARWRGHFRSHPP